MQATTPHYHRVYMDSAVYVDSAKLINHQGWFGKEIFYRAPFYPPKILIYDTIMLWPPPSWEIKKKP
jgi:hypothetical protein